MLNRDSRCSYCYIYTLFNEMFVSYLSGFFFGLSGSYDIQVRQTKENPRRFPWHTNNKLE